MLIGTLTSPPGPPPSPLCTPPRCFLFHRRKIVSSQRVRERAVGPCRPRPLGRRLIILGAIPLLRATPRIPRGVGNRILGVVVYVMSMAPPWTGLWEGNSLCRSLSTTQLVDQRTSQSDLLTTHSPPSPDSCILSTSSVCPHVGVITCLC